MNTQIGTGAPRQQRVVRAGGKAMKKTKGRITRDGAAVRRVQVMLDDATVERAKLLGKGNVSQGIRGAIKRAPVWINFFPGSMRDERGFEFSAEPVYAPEDLKGFVDSIIRGCTSSMDCSDAETLLNALPALAYWFCSTVDNRTKQQQAQLDAVQELSEALKDAAK